MTSADLRARLAAITGTNAEDWFPVFKARYGMLAAFEALATARRERREVVTQTLTCSTAIDPILVAGLTPVYAEVSAESFAIDPARLSLPDAPAALVIQHTFGVVSEQPARLLAQAARAGGALVVEDSAHCVARVARDETGAPLADVSVHSFGVEKMLPTKFGGAVWVNPALPDAELRAAIVAALSALPAPGLRLGVAARTYRTGRKVVSRLPAGVGRALTRARLFSPAVSLAEREGRLEHEAVAASDWVAGKAEAALRDLPLIEGRRAAAANAYAESLGGPSGQPLVRYPVLVPAGVDAGEVVKELTARGIYAGTWYRPAFFPGTSDPSVYRYTPGSLPVTEDVVSRIVNLPTDVTPERALQIAAAYRALVG